MQTLTEILTRHDIAVADELLADLVVPVLDGVQRQGDVLIVPRAPLSAAERKDCVPVPREGIAVVVGEATGNTHMLDGVGVLFGRRTAGLVMGVVEVPEGTVGYLIHTDEHGANAMAPGTYALHGKREQAEEIRRVAD